MGAFARRDEDWFTGVYAAHHAPVARYALRRLADREAAAELAQEVFAVAWRRREEVPDRSLPWLYGVARRLLANRWRGERVAARALPVLGAEASRQPAQAGADAGVEVADVLAALATLGEADQELLRLVGWEELTVAEAGEVLGCGRAAAAVRLHRARRRLVAAMSGDLRGGPAAFHHAAPAAHH
jgi:RNA polymerase sigma factor (sigma-70 family)